MKKVLLYSFILVILSSCTEKPNSSAEKEKVVSGEIHPELYGFWVGDFLYEGTDGPMMDDDFVDKLNVNIKRITKDSVFAQSIVKGEIKPLVGEIKEVDGKISFVLRQTTNEKNNGVFQCKLQKDTLIGTWKAYSGKGDVMEYKLIKKQPIYDAGLMLPEDVSFTDWYTYQNKLVKDTVDGEVSSYKQPYYRSASKQILKLNASTAILKEEELKNLTKLDLEIIRNTIFARHGYIFKKEMFRQFFDPVAWYVPINANIDGQLTNIEKTNIALLTRFEKYTTDNYDTFGR